LLRETLDICRPFIQIFTSAAVDAGWFQLKFSGGRDLAF
jgi:hypothetical protein